MVALSSVRNLVFNAAFLASVAAAAAVSTSGGFTPFRPPVPPAPPPPPPPSATYTISYLPAGGIWTSTDQCGPSNQVGLVNGPNIANYIVARRISVGLPNLFVSAGITDTANDHTIDMIRDGYVSIITNDSPPVGLIPQLNSHGVFPVTETKTIILVGCFSNNRLVDLWNVLQSDPGFASIVNRPDWAGIGAVCHHPALVAGSYPGLPSQNYWQIIFVK